MIADVIAIAAAIGHASMKHHSRIWDTVCDVVSSLVTVRLLSIKTIRTLFP
jgi:uncharacterized protein YsxB (DUF464 family)